MRSTARRWGLFAALSVAVLALRPARDHVAAVRLLGVFAKPDAGPSPDVDERPFPITPAGVEPVRARLYAPRGGGAGSLVLIPGVHHLGIDEPRLVHFARAIAGAGVTVLTPEVRELTDYRIDGASADAIGQAAQALHAHTGRRTGVMGMSFAGGLSLLAAADPRFSGDVAFVIAVGAHDDLGRVARFFETNEIARPDGTIVHLAAHPYGPLVLVYDRVQDFFPAEDVAVARDALRLWLWEDREAARAKAASLSPPSLERMRALFDDKLESVLPTLDAVLRAREGAMRAASPHDHLAGLRAPVLLLHGAGDSVIPASETLWLAQDAPKGLVEDVVISSAVVHVELEGEPGVREKWALVHFMAEVIALARDE